MPEVIVSDADSAPRYLLSINGRDHAGLVGVQHTVTDSVLATLRETHYRDNLWVAEGGAVTSGGVEVTSGGEVVTSGA
jgi:hypothetical protein